MKIKIKGDVFDIVARLKEIDERYGIVFDTESQSYEVTADGKSVLKLPFESLDERTVRRVLYTRFDNAENVLADIERDNENLRKDALKKAQDETEDRFSRAARLCGI